MLQKKDSQTANSHSSFLKWEFQTCTKNSQSLAMILQATTFGQVINSDEGTEEKAITAMGLLNTISTILTVMEDQKEIMAQLEGIVLNVVGVIIQNSVMGELRTVTQQFDDFTSRT